MHNSVFEPFFCDFPPNMQRQIDGRVPPKPLPPPRTLEETRAGWEGWAEWERQYKFYITKIALYPLKPVTWKFNISLDERLARKVDRVTNNRSAFIANAVENMLNSL